jgi:hypothetical protein
MPDSIGQMTSRQQPAVHQMFPSDNEQHWKQSKLGAESELVQQEMAVLNDLEQKLAASLSSARVRNARPLKQNQLSAYKLKRQPFQCLVNVVSCWK